MHTVVEFTAEGPERTRVSVRWQPSESATPADIAEFAKQRGSMTGGWAGSFDKLEALLGNAPAWVISTRATNHDLQGDELAFGELLGLTHRGLHRQDVRLEPGRREDGSLPRR